MWGCWYVADGGSDGKASVYNAGDPGSIPGSGRSPGEGNGNPLQYSCLENPMDGGIWWAIVHEVTKSWTRLGDFTHFTSPYIPKYNTVCFLLKKMIAQKRSSYTGMFHRMGHNNNYIID